MAQYKSFKIDSSTNNVPTAYSTAAGSLALTGITGLNQQTLTFVSEIAGRIAVCVSQNSSTTAPTSQVDLYIPPAPSGGFSAVTIDLPNVASAVYLKSDTGSALTSGVVYGWVGVRPGGNI